MKAIKSLYTKWRPGLSLVSGSGSAVFGLFEEKRLAEKVFRELKRKYDARIIETLSRVRYWDNLEAGV
jgi:4-diphosphocytidyl-2-C-methyl-D-erythritol kinase